MNSARNQTRYQVRFAFGIDAANDIADGAHIVVWADAIGPEPDPTTLAHGGALVAGTVGSRAAVAAWILARQADLGDRAIVAVVAAGDDSGGFAVEDLVAAGAVIEALAAVGIDYASPEAAAAGGAWLALKNAAAHVLSASVAGQEVLAAGGTLDTELEAQREPSIRIIREFLQPQ